MALDLPFALLLGDVTVPECNCGDNQPKDLDCLCWILKGAQTSLYFSFIRVYKTCSKLVS